MQCAGLKFSPRFDRITLTSFSKPGLLQKKPYPLDLKKLKPIDFYDGFELSQFCLLGDD
jgi:hypothetical protein